MENNIEEFIIFFYQQNLINEIFTFNEKKWD
jgi:hypothetical protein